MDRKTRNMLIAVGIVGTILFLMAMSVWQSTKVVDPQPGQSGTATGLDSIVIEPALVEPVPEDITGSGIPPLKITFSNTSDVEAAFVPARIYLSKLTYRMQDDQNAEVIAQEEVRPEELNGGNDLFITLGAGKHITHLYEMGEYFSFEPGVFDIGLIIKPGGLRLGGLVNTAPIESFVQITIQKGTALAGRLLNKGGSSEVARLNGQSISASEFMDTLVRMHGHELLQNMLAEKAVWQELDKYGIAVTPEDVEYAIRIEREVVQEQLKSVPFEEYLNSIGSSLKELRESRGFLLRIAIRKYLLSITPEPANEDLIAFFSKRYHWYGREEMVQARKIVCVPHDDGQKSDAPRAREAAIDKLLAIRAEITSGKATFDDAVFLYSQDPRARVSAGTMEPFRSYSQDRANDVPQVVADVAFRLKPGEISTPIEVPEEGFMLIQVQERIPPITVVYKDVKEQVRYDYLYDSIAGDRIQAWIQEIMQNSSVAITADYARLFIDEGKLDRLKHYETDLIRED